MTVFVLGDEQTVGVMRLAGLDGRAIPPGGDAAEAFEEALSIEGLGVLFVAENVADMIRDRVETAKLARHFPLVLEIPARGHPPSPVEDIVDRVARSVGLKR
jgi:vacuolar-type H+-ATPase subunit F/Vma7